MKTPLRLSALVLLLFGMTVSSVQAQSYTFAVVPQQSTQKLAEAWQPLFDEVERISGVTLAFRTAPDIPEFEVRLKQEEYDFAYMNPFHFTVFNQQPGYAALAREKDKAITGIIVVPKSFEGDDLSDLANVTAAFPAPLAFAATMVTKSHLSQANVSFTETFVRTHDSVYLNVAQGRFDIGGGVMRTFNNMPPEVKDQLRVLWTSPGYTPHAIAVHPRVPEEVVASVLAALLQVETTESGQAALNGLGMAGFEAAMDSDWDDVRNLNIRVE